MTNQPPTIQVGYVFVDDHESRDLPMPRIASQTKWRRTLYVEPDHPGWIDLLDDAKFYADDDMGFDDDLRNAAKRLVKAMLKAEAELR